MALGQGVPDPVMAAAQNACSAAGLLMKWLPLQSWVPWYPTMLWVFWFSSIAHTMPDPAVLPWEDTDGVGAKSQNRIGYVCALLVPELANGVCVIGPVVPVGCNCYAFTAAGGIPGPPMPLLPKPTFRVAE